MEAHLQFGTQTAHGMAADHAPRAKMLGRITSPRGAAPGWGRRIRDELLPPVSGGVEDQRVQVDLSTLRVDQDATRRQPWLRGSVVVEPDGGESPASPFEVTARKR